MKTQESLQLKELEYLYDNFLGGSIGYGVVINFIYYVFYAHAELSSLNLWYGLSMLIITLRFITFYLYQQANPLTSKDLHNFYKLYLVYIILSGALLGACALFVMPQAIEYQMILVLFAGGLCVGASVSLATRLILFYIYLALSLGPLVFHFITSDL